MPRGACVGLVFAKISSLLLGGERVNTCWICRGWTGHRSWRECALGYLVFASLNTYTYFPDWFPVGAAGSGWQALDRLFYLIAADIFVYSACLGHGRGSLTEICAKLDQLEHILENKIFTGPFHTGATTVGHLWLDVFYPKVWNRATWWRRLDMSSKTVSLWLYFKTYFWYKMDSSHL